MNEPPPPWEAFAHRFGTYIPAGSPMEAQPLTAERLRRALVRMGAATTPGPDGWRVAELRVLPLPFLERLAALFLTVEKSICLAW